MNKQRKKKKLSINAPERRENFIHLRRQKKNIFEKEIDVNPKTFEIIDRKEEFIENIIEFTKTLGKTSKEKALKEILRSEIEDGIEIRLLTEEEFKNKLRGMKY